MNPVKKMLIKSDFFKAIDGHPDSWRNVSLYYFEGDVHRLNRVLGETLTLCLSNLFGHDVVLIPESSNERSLVFSIPDLDDRNYKLANGKVFLYEDGRDSETLSDFTRYSDSLELISNAYDSMMSVYRPVEIPLTERVSFCYGFYEGKYFLLKDKKDLNKGIKIHTSFSKEDVDTDQDCFFPWLTFEVLIKRIRINPDYDANFKMVEEQINDTLMDLRKDLGLVKARENCDASVTEENNRFIIREDNLFEVINGIKFVREEWKRHLRYLDLKDISFEGVYVAGLDFRGCNAVVNPNEVCGRNLSNCRFDSVYCSDDFNFDGCNVQGMIVGDIILDGQERRIKR